MIKILFVCHGNICRSTMAQFVFEDLARKAGMSGQFFVDSAATSREEIGNDVDFRTRHKLEAEGIFCGHHRARQVTRQDYEDYDWIVLMDEENRRGIRRIIPEDPEKKIRLLLDWSPWPGDIADPWYTGDFDRTYDDVLEGCTYLLKALK